jgi:muramidase (phage lysozyme)
MATPFQNLPSQRRLLDAIAAGEAPDYDVMYGGGRFGSYADHPRQYIPIQSGPNQGRKSSAAGRYQFLAGTWDEVAKELGLPDFTPDSQNKGAWHLAAKTYQAKTGRDLLTDLDAGRTQDVAPALAGVWTSIPGGIEPNKASGGFAGRLGSDAPSVATASSGSPAGAVGAPMGLLPQTAGDPQTDQIQGLLAGLMGQQQQQASPMGLLDGMPQQQPEPQPGHAPEPPPDPRVRRPINLAGLQALLQRPRLGASWSV